MNQRQLDALLLAGVGTLAVHELAYLPGSVGAGVAHDHLPALWFVGGTAAVLALGRSVVRSIRARRVGRTVDPVALVGAIAAFFLVQESIEHAASGAPAISVLAQPVVWLGLLAAPAVGLALARLVNTIVELVVTVEPSLPTWVDVGPQSFVVAGPPVPATGLLQLRHHLSRRGPPRVVR